MASIVVVGSLNMDLVATTPRLPLPGETLIGKQFTTVPGGKGANQAFAAARLGGDVIMLGRVGSDDYGRQMRANLQSAGCDVTELKAVDGSSGVALIQVEDSAQNSIIVIPGANHLYTPADLQADAHALENAQFLLLQLETPLSTVEAATHVARRHGVRVILDPAPAPGSLPKALLNNVDILTPNETEASTLAGKRSTHLNADEARSTAKKLLELGVGTVVLKLGEQGCLLALPDRMESIAAPKVAAVDTTAAGDVFNGALAVALSEGAALADACRFAVRAAAVSVTRFGAQTGMPGRGEIDSPIN